MLREYEEILEVHARLPVERRVVREEQREADGLAAIIGDQRLGVAMFAEEVCP